MSATRLCAFALVSSALAASASPLVLTHSGRLLSGSDVPLEAPALELTFRVLDAASATVGEQVSWTATCTVAVVQGFYSLNLGEAPCAGDGLDTADFPAGSARYLEVSVGAVTLSPRARVQPALQVEADPRVGTLTPGKWCKADATGTQVVCTSDLTSSAIGDVKFSFLTEPQFTLVNGPGWVLADGRSIVGSAYAALTGRTTVEDARGRFLRSTGGAAAALGLTQEDELKSHSHPILVRRDAANGSQPNGDAPANGTNGQGGNPYANTDAVGGAETRPRNISANVFVRIN